jgi:prepilin-type N-terminal cleavage/methylation domain-containing protein
MKSEFKAKFLQHLLKRKEDEGFTLIELLVCIIIIGILSAIALPSFLNQANKARESEAKQYMGSMNRARQAFFLERTKFTTEFGRLRLGIQTQIANYAYHIVSQGGTYTPTPLPGSTSGSTMALAQNGIYNIGQPLSTTTLRAFVGCVDIFISSSIGDSATTLALLVQSIEPGNAATDQACVIDPGSNPTEPTLGDAAIWEVIR